MYGKLETVRTLVELGVEKEAKDEVRNLIIMMMMMMMICKCFYNMMIVIVMIVDRIFSSSMRDCMT